MTDAIADPSDIPEVDLSDRGVVRDPFTAYGHARERAPLARILTPGFGPMWALTRYDGVKSMLSDSRFVLKSESFMRPDVPEDCLPYMRTMSEMDGREHRRLRRLVAPAFTVRRAEQFRSRIEPLVADLLDNLPEHAEDGTVDLLQHFAKPLPMDVICEMIGIPRADRPKWREYGAAVAAGHGPAFVEAIPGIMAGAKSAIAARRAEPGDDVLDDLIRVQAEDGDRLSDSEMVTLVWHLVIAGQTPTNLIANAVAALLSHPQQLAALRADPALMPGAVEELMRWCGSALLAVPRYAQESLELYGIAIAEGAAVTAAIAAANRDPRAFTDPDRMDISRTSAPAAHVGFGHGPHFCLGAALARIQAEVAFTSLLRRFPDLSPAVAPEELRAPDPGTWRLSRLPLTLH